MDQIYTYKSQLDLLDWASIKVNLSPKLVSQNQTIMQPKIHLKIKKIQYQINIVKSLNCVCCVLQFIIYLLFRSSPRWDKKERVDGAQQYKIWNRPTRQCSPWAWFIGPKSPLLYTVAIYSRYCYIIYHNQQPRIDTHFLSASGPSLDTTHCVITETVASSPCRSSSGPV